MASTHELMRLEELTTAALVLARMDLGDAEARVVPHWNPTKILMNKLPDEVKLELKLGDRVVAHSSAAIAPFGEGESRAARDAEQRQLAGRRTALTFVIQELAVREAVREAVRVEHKASPKLFVRVEGAPADPHMVDYVNKVVSEHRSSLQPVVIEQPDSEDDVREHVARIKAEGLAAVGEAFAGADEPVVAESAPYASCVTTAERCCTASDPPTASEASGKKVPLSKVVLFLLQDSTSPLGPTDVAGLMNRYGVDRRQAQNLLNGLKNRELVKRKGERKVPSGHLEGLYVLTKEGRKAAEVVA